MRTFTLKGLFLTAVFMVLGCLAIHAADDDLITRQITVKLDEAGTLPDKIGSIKKYKLTNLKIVGEINGTDLRFIRDMAQNILVIKTVAGMASAVCAALDAMKWNEIVGSIAGDDTIMCAIRSVDDTVKVMDKISKIIL